MCAVLEPKGTVVCCAAAARTEHWLIQREKLQQRSQAEVERGGEAPWSCRQPPPPPPLFPLQTKTHTQSTFFSGTDFESNFHKLLAVFACRS